ncbi:MAG: DUF2357 domain-containing protein [Deltaproteobacteria bacterium]|nr:DUF2357 domain-containing protein [Deltaproteobacteria bacterium]
MPDGVVLRGEIEWIVEGGEAEIAALLDAVVGLGVKVSAQAAIVKFGNVVGTFALGQLGAVRVECGKWGEDVFDALLDDLTNRALALPFSATQAAGLPHDRSIADRDDVLLHAFVYARYILLAANRVLPRALELVVRDPHRRFSPERASVELVTARRVDARTIERVVMGADGVVRATGHAAHSALAHALRGHLPAYVDVPRVENTFDTVENRFVLEFLGQLRGIIDRVERLARSKAKPASFWTRAVADCETMRRVLGPFERHDMWNDVGRMGHVPIGSSVLQRRRGYKDILRHHLALRAAARIPFDRTTVEKLLGLKDVATLYELWCYFAVVDAVGEIIGRRPDYADAMKVKDEVDLGYGFRVAWNDGPSVYYNLSFTSKTPPPRRSASLWLRPDIVVDIKRDGQRELHAFDAKLRIDGAPPSGEVDEAADDDAEATQLSFKNDDIAKMHAYRDALPHVRSARVIYPGNEACEFPALEPDARDADGVGAIPLIPGKSATMLVGVLARILEKGRPSMPRAEAGHQEPTRDDVAAVAALLAEIERIEGMPVEWGGGQQADGSIQTPFVVYAPGAQRLISAIYEHNLIMNFDWSAWRDEAQCFAEAERIRTASLDDVRRLLTLHVRMERFVEGHLSEVLASGQISPLLRRLGELAREWSAEK